jgi:hypothetical protein
MNINDLKWATSVRDLLSGEVGKVSKVVGEDVQIWLFQSNATVWRFAVETSGEVEIIDANAYDQACYEWEMNQAFGERGEAGDFDPQI